MKKIVQRLVACLLAGVVCTGGLAGCGQDTDIDDSLNSMSERGSNETGTVGNVQEAAEGGMVERGNDQRSDSTEQNNSGNVAITGQSGQIMDQSFQVTLDGWGEVTFAPFSPELWFERPGDGIVVYGDVYFQLLKNGSSIYTFPGAYDNNEMPAQQFGQVVSVAFRDYNEDGRADILLILEYAGVQGPNIDVPFREARAYTQKEGEKEFILDSKTSNYLRNYTDNMEQIYQGLSDYSQLYSVCTDKNAWEVERFLEKVRQLILNGDYEGLLQEVSFPVMVDGVSYGNSVEFLAADFVTSPNPEFLEALGKVSADDPYLIANWQGIMLDVLSGDNVSIGGIWISEILSGDVSQGFVSQGLKVTAISGLSTAD